MFWLTARHKEHKPNLFGFCNINRLINIQKWIEDCKMCSRTCSRCKIAKFMSSWILTTNAYKYTCKIISVALYIGTVNMTQSYDDHLKDYTEIFLNGSSPILTQVSVSIIKPLLWSKRWGEERGRKERSGKGQGSHITPPHLKKKKKTHFPPCHALLLSEWTNPE